jgi:hypothetical protein
MDLHRRVLGRHRIHHRRDIAGGQRLALLLIPDNLVHLRYQLVLVDPASVHSLGRDILKMEDPLNRTLSRISVPALH